MCEVPWTTWPGLAEELHDVLRMARDFKLRELPAVTDKPAGRILLAIAQFPGESP
jgi:hypothetical protein